MAGPVCQRIDGENREHCWLESIRHSKFGFCILILYPKEAEIPDLHPVRAVITLSVVLPITLAALLGAARFAGKDTKRPWLRLRSLLAAEFLGFLILCAAGYGYERHARARAANLYPMPGRMVDVGGYRLHLNCVGEEGPTVVLDYGLEGSYFDWYRVQPEIAKFARVCLYDRAGYGWSDASSMARVPSVTAEELHTLLHAAGETPPYIVVGHSYGALIAEMFAHKFPQDTAGAVLVDGFVLRSAPWFPLRYKLWLRFQQWTEPFGLPRWRGWCAEGPAQFRGEAEAAYCRSRVYAAYYREHAQLALGGAEVRAIASLGSTPLIVISRDPLLHHKPGEESGHMKDQEEMAKLSSNGRLVIAKGSGHDVPGMRPDVIIDAVKGLVRPPEQAGSPGTP